jgi:hypothetical protein
VNQVTEFRWVDFLVLGGNQERRDTNELKLWSGDVLNLEVSVNEVDGKVQSLRNEFEFQVNLHKPVNKDRSHTFIDVGLVLHVSGTHRGHGFLDAEVLIHILDVAGNAKWVIGIAFINVVGQSILIARKVDFRLRWLVGASGSKRLLTGIDHLACRVHRVSLLQDE